MKFAAFDALLQDPGTFKDPDKLAETLAMGAAFGVGAGGLGKLLGKGLGKLKPSELAKLGQKLGMDGSGLSRLKLRPSEWEKLPASIRSMFKKCDRDPIDVATGDMLMPQTDVELPGTLSLVLERTHLSSYRWGGWFGPTWASTLDQRLQADDDCIVYAAADGARLIYPHPDPDTADPVYPELGPRIPLAWDGEVDGALRITDPDTGLAYTFHSPRPTDDSDAVDLPLQSIQDRNGQRITLHYADDGTPVEVAHSGGYRIALDRHRDLPRISALRLLDPERPDGLGTVLVSYGYSEDGHLTEVTNSSGLPLRFTYDSEGRITSWTDRNDTAYHYTYDEHGRVVHTEGSADFLSGTLSYDDATRTTTVTNSLGHITRYEYNEALRLVRETDPLGHTTVQEWDAEQRLIAVTDPLGHTTRYLYDEHGRIASVIRPDGHATTGEYNSLGLPTMVIGPDGGTWIQEYDERGNRTSVTDPTGATTQFTYNKSGHLTQVTDHFGQTTHIRCDQAGLPLEITDPLGAVTRSERDVFGRTVALTDALGSRTQQEWTVEGHPARRIAPDGTTESWTYDGEGNCTSHIDSAGACTRFEYSHFGLTAARTEQDGTRYTFVHDTELRPIQVTNGQGMTWRYSYDAAGRLVAETDFDGRSVAYAYDAADRLISRTNALGQTIRYTRDVLGQTTRKDADGAVSTYAYDLAGHLVRATGPDADLTQERDAAGLLLSESVNGRTVTHAYDVLGNRVSRTTPIGATSSWSYDAAGRVAELATGGRTIRFDHDPVGRELARHMGESLTVASAFDELGRLTQQSVTDNSTANSIGSSVQRRSYAYGHDGNLTHLADQLNGTRDFDLDAAGRVTAVRASNWAETYAYDAAGNQTEASWPSSHPGHEATGTRTYSGTRITRAGSTRYEHDAAGRVTLRQKARLSRKPDTWHYVWDAEDRLTSVVTPDGARWRYAYDPLGRRIAKQRLADDDTVLEQTDFTWDGATLCEQTTASVALPDPVTLTWDYRDLRPIAQTERLNVAGESQDAIDSRFFAIVTDLVGTPTELVDETGSIAWRTRATLWGTTTWASDSTAYTPLRFPGQYFDPETGLHYNHFRHYDPETARYLSPDPLGLAPAPNPVAYVHNPHAWIDPLGLACTEPPQNVIQTPELVAPKPLKPHQVLDEWQKFLGDSPYTNVHPRTGNSDPDRLVSADGLRSIRMGPHEMNSKPTKFHFHKETWTFVAPTNTWIVDNTMVRVPLGLK
ncbi:RHS repeat-associated core domain-containing protein [Streptomyces sp. NPDC041068]|uniref:RHS repeat-associated core domain-containing protein n=1 Tax=Streptomyces sp. NPDC041068 TaxID=3155130 RepID=UPI0033C02911